MAENYVFEEDALDEYLEDSNQDINELLTDDEIRSEYRTATYKTYMDSAGVDLYYCDILIESGLISFEVIDTTNPVFSYDSETYNMLTGGSNYVQGSILVPLDSTNVDVIYRITLKRIFDLVNALYTLPIELQTTVENDGTENSILESLDSLKTEEGENVPANVLELFASFFLDLVNVKLNQNPDDPDYNASTVLAKMVNFINNMNNLEDHPLYKGTVIKRIINAMGQSYRTSTLTDLVESIDLSDEEQSLLAGTDNVITNKKYITLKYLGYKRALKEFSQIVTEVYNMFMSYMDMDDQSSSVNYETGENDAISKTLYKAYISGIYERFTLDIVYKARFAPKNVAGNMTPEEFAIGDDFEDVDYIKENRVKYRMVDTLIGVQFLKEGMQQVPDGKAIYRSYNYIAQKNIYDEPRNFADYDTAMKLILEGTPPGTQTEDITYTVKQLIEFTRTYSQDNDYYLSEVSEDGGESDSNEPVYIYGIEYLADRDVTLVYQYYDEFSELIFSDSDGDNEQDQYGWIDYYSYEVVTNSISSGLTNQDLVDQGLSRSVISPEYEDYDGGNNFALFLHNVIDKPLENGGGNLVDHVFKIEDFSTDDAIGNNLFPRYVVQDIDGTRSAYDFAYNFINETEDVDEATRFSLNPIIDRSYFVEPVLSNIYLFSNEQPYLRLGEIIFDSLHISESTLQGSPAVGLTFNIKQGQYFEDDLAYGYCVTPFNAMFSGPTRVSHTTSAIGDENQFTYSSGTYSLNLSANEIEVYIKIKAGDGEKIYNYVSYYDGPEEKVAIDVLDSVPYSEASNVISSTAFTDDTRDGKGFYLDDELTITEVLSYSITNSTQDFSSYFYITDSDMPVDAQYGIFTTYEKWDHNSISEFDDITVEYVVSDSDEIINKSDFMFNILDGIQYDVSSLVDGISYNELMGFTVTSGATDLDVTYESGTQFDISTDDPIFDDITDDIDLDLTFKATRIETFSLSTSDFEKIGMKKYYKLPTPFLISDSFKWEEVGDAIFNHKILITMYGVDTETIPLSYYHETYEGNAINLDIHEYDATAQSLNSIELEYDAIQLNVEYIIDDDGSPTERQRYVTLLVDPEKFDPTASDKSDIITWKIELLSPSNNIGSNELLVNKSDYEEVFLYDHAICNLSEHISSLTNDKITNIEVNSSGTDYGFTFDFDENPANASYITINYDGFESWTGGTIDFDVYSYTQITDSATLVTEYDSITNQNYFASVSDKISITALEYIAIYEKYYTDDTDNSTFTVTSSGVDITSNLTFDHDNKQIIMTEVFYNTLDESTNFPLTIDMTYSKTNQDQPSIVDYPINCKKYNGSFDLDTIVLSAEDTATNDITDKIVIVPETSLCRLYIYNQDTLDDDLLLYDDMAFDITITTAYEDGVAIDETYYLVSTAAEVDFDVNIDPMTIPASEKSLSEFTVKYRMSSGGSDEILFSIGEDVDNIINIDFLDYYENNISYSSLRERDLGPDMENVITDFIPDYIEKPSVYFRSFQEMIAFHFDNYGISYIKEDNGLIKLDPDQYAIVDDRVTIELDGTFYSFFANDEINTYEYVIQYMYRYLYDYLMEYLYDMAVDTYPNINAFIVELDFKHEYDDPRNGTYFFVDRTVPDYTPDIPEPEEVTDDVPLNEVTDEGIYYSYDDIGTIWNVDTNEKVLSVIKRSGNNFQSDYVTGERIATEYLNGSYIDNAAQVWIKKYYVPGSNLDFATESASGSNEGHYVVPDKELDAYTITGSGSSTDPYVVTTVPKAISNDNRSFILVEELDDGSAVMQDGGTSTLSLYGFNDFSTLVAEKKIVDVSDYQWYKCCELERGNMSEYEFPSGAIARTSDRSGGLETKGEEFWLLSRYVKMLSKRARYKGLEDATTMLIDYVDDNFEVEKSDVEISLYGLKPLSSDVDAMAEYIMDIVDPPNTDGDDRFISIWEVNSGNNHVVIKNGEYIQEKLIESGLYGFDDTISEDYDTTGETASLIAKWRSL